MPGVEIHLLTAQNAEPLACFLPNVSQYCFWQKRDGLMALFRLAWQLRKQQYFGVVNLHPSLKTLIVSLLLRPIPQAIYHKQKIKQKGALQRAISRRHATQDFYEPFRALVAESALSALPAPLLIPPLEMSLNKPPDQQWVGIIPGVGHKRGNRAWLPERYAQLINLLLDENTDLKIALVGGPDDQATAERVLHNVEVKKLAHVQNYCGRLAIPQTLALLAACDVVIGGDTGPLHMAAALGCQVLGLYGPTSVQRTGPQGCGAIATLTPPESLQCWPCEAPTCPYEPASADYLACMKEIPVEQVKAQAFALLKQNGVQSK